MLGDPQDPLALEHEPQAVQTILQRYINGELELPEAESHIDWELYIGEAGAAHHKQDEEVRQDWLDHRAPQAWIEADIERARVRAKAKAHRPTPVDHIERVAATLRQAGA